MKKFLYGVFGFILLLAAAVAYVDRRQPTPQPLSSPPAPVHTTAAAVEHVTSGGGSHLSMYAIMGMFAVLACGFIFVMVHRKPKLPPKPATRPADAARPSGDVGRYWLVILDSEVAGRRSVVWRRYIEREMTRSQVKADIIGQARRAQPGVRFWINVAPATREVFESQRASV
jgi:hypothetical protein